MVASQSPTEFERVRIVKKAGRAISVNADTVVKLQQPSASRRERLRTEAGHRVGQETGLFLVPAVLSFDDERGEIVFERLRATGFRQALAGRDGGEELVDRAARALAAIHRQLAAGDEPDASGYPASPIRPTVPLHGDFGVNNLYYLPDDDRLAIIDWSNADWIEYDADLGPPEIDVAIFLLSLFERRVFGPSPVRRRHELARRFLDTYAAASPHGLDVKTLRETVVAFAPPFARLNLERQGHLRSLVRRHSRIDLDFFLRRLSKEGLASPTDVTEIDEMPQSRTALPYVERHKGRGADYAETFSPEANPYRAMVWRLERRALDDILRRYLVPGKIAQLDFACGTGRILGHFRDQVASATGVDVSPSMMEVARTAAPAAELIEADLTRNDVLGDRSFDLVTAFRFFPNAEPELRRSALSALARHLAPGGILVFNNHKNRNSLRRRLLRLLGRDVVTLGTMSHVEVESLVAGAGLQILEVVPLAVLPTLGAADSPAHGAGGVARAPPGWTGRAGRHRPGPHLRLRPKGRAPDHRRLSGGVGYGPRGAGRTHGPVSASRTPRRGTGTGRGCGARSTT